MLFFFCNWKINTHTQDHCRYVFFKWNRHKECTNCCFSHSFSFNVFKACNWFYTYKCINTFCVAMCYAHHRFILCLSCSRFNVGWLDLASRHPSAPDAPSYSILAFNRFRHVNLLSLLTSFHSSYEHVQCIAQRIELYTRFYILADHSF